MTNQELIRIEIEKERKKIRELTREYIRLDRLEEQRRGLRIIDGGKPS